MNVFLTFLLILPLVYQVAGWSYDDPASWGDESPGCNGKLQSPIALSRSNSIVAPLPPLILGNYKKPLRGPLTLVNNGHSVNLDLPVTQNGQRAFIIGGQMLSKFEAVGLHFHWGSEGNGGSEHTINKQRYDVELHIVHKNVKYETVDEATQYSDGLAVLGGLINIDDEAATNNIGLNKILNQLPKVIEYNSSATIKGELSLAQILGDVKTNEFYTYNGSLTTPGCAEAVIWNVLPDPILASSSQISKFFDILDNRGASLVNNYRPLQAINNRPIVYRKA